MKVILGCRLGGIPFEYGIISEAFSDNEIADLLDNAKLLIENDLANNTHNNVEHFTPLDKIQKHLVNFISNKEQSPTSILLHNQAPSDASNFFLRKVKKMMQILFSILICRIMTSNLYIN